jgi:hypothetical protein
MKWGVDIMHILTLAVTGSLAIALSAPAFAAKKKSAPASSVGTFEACETKALGIGPPHGQAGHNEYVRECMGQRPRGRTTG